MQPEGTQHADLYRLLRLGYVAGAGERILEIASAGEDPPPWAQAAIALARTDEFGFVEADGPTLDHIWSRLTDPKRARSPLDRELAVAVHGRFPRRAARNDWQIGALDDDEGAVHRLARNHGSLLVIRTIALAVTAVTAVLVGIVHWWSSELGLATWQQIAYGFAGLVVLTYCAAFVRVRARTARLLRSDRIDPVTAVALHGRSLTRRRRRPTPTPAEESDSDRPPGSWTVMSVDPVRRRRALLFGLLPTLVPFATVGVLMAGALILELAAWNLGLVDSVSMLDGDVAQMLPIFIPSAAIGVWLAVSPRVALPRAVPSRAGWGMRRARLFSVLGSVSKRLMRAALRACLRRGPHGSAVLLRSFEDDVRRHPPGFASVVAAPPPWAGTAPAAATVACAGWLRLRMIAPAESPALASHEYGRFERRRLLRRVELVRLLSEPLGGREWQSVVGELIADATVVFVSAAYTPGITSELELVRDAGATDRIVCMFPIERPYSTRDVRDVVAMLGVDAALPDGLDAKRPLALCATPHPTLFVTSAPAASPAALDLALEFATRMVMAHVEPAPDP